MCNDRWILEMHGATVKIKKKSQANSLQHKECEINTSLRTTILIEE
jgi:hypothetical protein